MSNETGSGTMGASAATAGELLLLAAANVPPTYYLVAFVLFVVVLLYNFLELHVLSDVLHGFLGDPVQLTFSPDSRIYCGVAAKCRSLHGRYLVTPWLASPHLQTVFLSYFGRPPSFDYNRQIYRTRDGGTIALDWLLCSDVAGGGSSQVPATGISKEDTTPLLVVIPGLTSDSSAAYVKHLVHKMAQNGWNVVAGNHRGLGGMSMTSDCFYHAGWTEDVREVINHLHKEYPNAPMYAVGTSIGGNILVKYLGEEGENTPLAGAASVCSPWDLLVCDRYINRKLVQRLYNWVLANGLREFAEMHKPVVSRLANWEGICKARSVREFDSHATCFFGQFETADTYYRRVSSVNYMANVSVPLLCISAIDDPICTSEAIPFDECRLNKNIVLATTPHGGHLGFFQGLTAKRLWWVGAVHEFLSVLHNSPFMHNQKKVAVGLHSSLEPTIDKSPYVNITEDGMLSPAIQNASTENTASESEITSEDESMERITEVSALTAALPSSDKGKHKSEDPDLRRSTRTHKKTLPYAGMIETPTIKRGKTKVVSQAIKKALAEANLTKQLDEEFLLMNPMKEKDSDRVENFCTMDVPVNEATLTAVLEDELSDELTDDLPDLSSTPVPNPHLHQSTQPPSDGEEMVDYEPTPDGVSLASP